MNTLTVKYIMELLHRVWEAVLQIDYQAYLGHLNNPAVKIAGATLIFGALTYLLIRTKTRADTSLLSYWTDDKLSKRKRKYLYYKLKNLGNIVKSTYYPSIGACVVVVACIVGIAMLATFLHFLCLKIPPSAFAVFRPNDLFRFLINDQILLAIHAGIGTLIFALLIFIAGYLRSNTIEARVLLKESFIFPVTLAEILVLLSFIIFEDPWVYIFLALAMAFITVKSLSNVIIILLNKYLYSQKLLSLFAERIRENIYIALRERVANNILLAQLDAGEIKFKFSFLGFTNEAKCRFVYSRKLGIIHDVRMDKLKSLSDYIDGYAKDKGYVFGSKDRPRIDITPSEYKTEQEAQGDLRELKQNENRILLAKFRGKLDEEHNQFLAIDKDIVDDAFLNEIEQRAAETFLVRPDDNYSEEIRTELAEMKDRFLEVIDHQKLGSIDLFIQFYRGIAETFMSYLNELEVTYTAEEARKERGQILGGWSEMEWLVDDIRDFLNRGIRSNEKIIIRNSAYLPISIASRALKYHNHYVFQNFVDFPIRMYFAALDHPQHTDFLKKRANQYLYELAAYFIEPGLRKENINQKSAYSLKEALIYVIKIYQDLIRYTVDKMDKKGFDIYAATFLHELCEHFKPYSLRTIHQNAPFVENIKLDIEQKKQIALMGLSGWLLEKSLTASNSDKKWFIECYNTLVTEITSSLEELTILYMKACQGEEEDYWGWSWWDAPEKGGFSPNNDFRLDLIYCIKALNSIQHQEDASILQAKLPDERGFVQSVREDGTLSNLLQRIATEKDTWSDLVTEAGRNKINTLKKLFTNTAQKFKENERKLLIEKNLDESRIAEFKKEVIAGYGDGGFIKLLFKHYKLFQDLTHMVVQKQERFGINTLLDKEAFFESWHVSFQGYGKNYGSGIAEGESRYVLEKICEKCTVVRTNEFIANIEAYESKSKLIIFANPRGIYDYLRNVTVYKSDYSVSNRKLPLGMNGGWLEFGNVHVPVITVLRGKKMPDLVALDIERLGVLKYYCPINSEEERSHLYENFFIRIDAFSADEGLLNKFISSPPDWLSKKGSREDQITFLKQYSLVQIYEKLDFDFHSEFFGVRMKLDDNR